MSDGILHSLDHVIVGVRDLDAAVERTTLLMGREPVWRGEHPGVGTANALFPVANTYLELLSPAGKGAIGAHLADRLEAEGEGIVGLAFGTDDADAAAAALRNRGLTVFDPQPGEGRDAATGAERRWRNALVSPEVSRGAWIFAIEHTGGSLPALTPADAGVSGLDHVVVMTPDAEACRSLYGDGLGLRLALDRSFEERGARILFFRVGGATVEVGARLGAEPAPGAPDRLWGLAWQVADADAARARMHAAGLDVSEVRDGFKPGTRVFTVRGDPCGVATLVIEPSHGLPKAGPRD